jgi:hypothetical protein
MSDEDSIARYNVTKELITKLPTTIFGLKFFPSLEPHHNDDTDLPYSGWREHTQVSDDNLKIVSDIVNSLGDKLKACMEIGIYRDSSKSMTNVLINEKPKDCFYLGVDIDDKNELNDPNRNIFTIQCNSHDQEKIRSFLKSKNIDKLDILLIDGWHSVNTTINDWKYADLLSQHGIVIVHDTNTHPGDIALCEAIDIDMFNVERLCQGNDSGIALISYK